MNFFLFVEQSCWNFWMTRWLDTLFCLNWNLNFCLRFQTQLTNYIISMIHKGLFYPKDTKTPKHLADNPFSASQEVELTIFNSIDSSVNKLETKTHGFSYSLFQESFSLVIDAWQEPQLNQSAKGKVTEIRNLTYHMRSRGFAPNQRSPEAQMPLHLRHI